MKCCKVENLSAKWQHFGGENVSILRVAFVWKSWSKISAVLIDTPFRICLHGLGHPHHLFVCIFAFCLVDETRRGEASMSAKSTIVLPFSIRRECLES